MSSDPSYPRVVCPESYAETDISFCKEQCIKYENHECFVLDDPIQECPFHTLNSLKVFVTELSKGLYVHEFWWIEERAKYLLKNLISPTTKTEEK